jgi:6-phosphogluconolactonase
MTPVYFGTMPAGSMPGDPGKGVHIADFDPASGVLTLLQTVENPRGPSYLARHPTLPMLYAAEALLEEDRRDVGGLSTYAIDPKSGELTFRQRRSSGSVGATHVRVDPDGHFVFVASLRGHSLTVFPLDGQGQPGEPLSIMQFEGGGPHPRQADAMIHCAVVDPSGKFVLACDLGSDKIRVFRYDAAQGALTPAERPFAQLSSGAGPRHIKFHPRLPVAYVTNELDATVSVFAFSPESGTLSILQTIDPKPVPTGGKATCSELAFDAQGSQVFVAVRGDDVLASYAIDPITGRLTFLEHAPAGGANPMAMSVDPSDRYLLVANRSSASVRVFDITGAKLRMLDGHLGIVNPSCVLFG